MKFLFFVLICISFKANSQCDTYKITSTGDTLNCTDINKKKQGKWTIHHEPLRGESGFDEEGLFVDDKKDGTWRQFNDVGLLIAIENYKFGNKHGPQQYFEEGQLEHEESWLSLDPKKKFDTVDVPDLYNQYKVERKVIKVESYGIKHGIWKYYEPGTRRVTKTEQYTFGKLDEPDFNAALNTNAAQKNSSDSSLPKKIKPSAIQDFEKKNKGKKSFKYKDGSTG